MESFTKRDIFSLKHPVFFLLSVFCYNSPVFRKGNIFCILFPTIISTVISQIWSKSECHIYANKRLKIFNAQWCHYFVAENSKYYAFFTRDITIQTAILEAKGILKWKARDVPRGFSFTSSKGSDCLFNLNYDFLGISRFPLKFGIGGFWIVNKSFWCKICNWSDVMCFIFHLIFVWRRCLLFTFNQTSLKNFSQCPIEFKPSVTTLNRAKPPNQNQQIYILWVIAVNIGI